jgi:putative addiction module antidote
MELTITKVGEDFVLILPPDMLHYLGASEGDTIHFTETENGFRLAAHDADFDRAMKHADFVMAKYDSALRRLAE